MSGIHSITRGLPGSGRVRIQHPGGMGVTTKVTVVEAPPEARRRLIGGDPDQGVTNTTLRVVNNGANPADGSYVLVTPDGNFVIGTFAGLTPNNSDELDNPWVIRDDEHIEVWLTGAAALTVDVFATFSDLRSTEVGRERVLIKASTDATKYVVVPKPGPGRIHVPWGKSEPQPSYYIIRDTTPASPSADVSTYLDDDGTVVLCGDVVTTNVAGYIGSNGLRFGVRALKNQALLASALLVADPPGPARGDAWAFTTYLIVPDPKVGQAGSSA